MKNLQGDVVQILNSKNDVVANYSYDAWGNLIEVIDANEKVITSTTNFALINPIRYRGYYYDSETGFYYLKSRYYDPANCRFVSADTRLDLNHGTTNLNLFAYCGNDPVNRVDPNGTFGAAILDGINGLRGLLESSNTGFPYADAAMKACAVVVGVIGIAVSALVTSEVASQSTVTVAPGIRPRPLAPAVSAPKVKCMDDAIAEAKKEGTYNPPKFPTAIYRYYASKTENLAPRKGIDYDGLSFSTKPPRRGVPAVMTTIEQVNSTGILSAIPTGGTHVVVLPTNGSVLQWMAQGSSSVWTQRLSSIVIEWGSGD